MLRVDSIQHTVHVLITTTGVSITSTKKLILKNLQGLEKILLIRCVEMELYHHLQIYYVHNVIQLTKIGKPKWFNCFVVQVEVYLK